MVVVIAGGAALGLAGLSVGWGHQEVSDRLLIHGSRASLRSRAHAWLGSRPALVDARVRILRRRSAASLREQLIDAAVEIAACVRSGGSIAQGLERAAGEVAPPLGPQLHRIVVGASSDVPLEDGLRRWARSSSDPDVRFAAAVIAMHRRRGGDLPAMLDGLVETLRERLMAEREVASLTAQARLSGLVVGLLPLGFFAFLWLTSPGEMTSVMTSSLGVVLVGIGLTLEGLAFLWIRRILRVGR